MIGDVSEGAAMNHLFRAVVIDPEKQTIDVVVTTGTLDEIHRLLNAKTLDSFRIADYENSWDYGWVDDGGLSRGEPIPAFLFQGSRDPIGGRCLLIGVDKETRETCDAKFDLRILREVVEWLGVIKPEVVWDETPNGNRAIVTYSRVKPCR